LLFSLLFYLSFFIPYNQPPQSSFHFRLSQPDSHPFENSCNFPVLEDEDPSLKASLTLFIRPNIHNSIYSEVVTRSLNGSFIISSSILPTPFSCSVQILTGTLHPNVRSMNISDPVKLPLNKSFWINEDVFLIECRKLERNMITLQLIFSRVYMGVNQLEVHHLVVEVDEQNKEKEIPSRPFDINSMSISILVFDSTSRSQFARHMKNSRALMNEMGFVTLLGYNKVGDNSAPNLSPIIAEPFKENEEYDLMDETNDIGLNKFLPYNKKIDPDTIEFIWKKMKKKGCETLFNDDIMHTSRGLFHYTNRHFKPGFTYKPTDHYYRPFYNHLYKRLNNKWKLCSEGRRLSEEMLVPWFLSLRQLADQCFFSFNFITSPSHDNPNNLETVDEILSTRLRELKNSGSLSNTLLIVMGDHGQRMHNSQKSFAGRIEERQPLMSILLPREFRVHHPDAFNNLLTNIHRLTSNVDIHETLLDIIDNRLGKTRPKGRGTSLFTPIPIARTCLDAWLPKNFCLCQYTATEEERSRSLYNLIPVLIPPLFIALPHILSSTHIKYLPYCYPLTDLIAVCQNGHERQEKLDS
ncbi:hypothetical protein PMAYCL1PPCAC_21107, partial [Pristionchus mayeri]